MTRPVTIILAAAVIAAASLTAASAFEFTPYLAKPATPLAETAAPDPDRQQELDMIALQNLVSERQRAIQTTTRLFQILRGNGCEICGNIR